MYQEKAMPKKKNVKESPEPGEGEQKQLPLSRKKRLKEIGSGLGYLFGAILLLIFGVIGLYTGELRILMIGKTGSSGVFLHGPAVWILFLAYAGLSGCLIILGLDYLSKQDEHPKRDKVMYAVGMLAAVSYISALIISGIFGEHGDLLSKREKEFGVYFNLHGPALLTSHLVSVCIAIFVITFLPWRTKKPDILGKARNVLLYLMVALSFATSVLAFGWDRGLGSALGSKKAFRAFLTKNTVQGKDDFFESVKKNDIEGVKLFLSVGMDINALSEGSTALAVAAGKGHKELVQLLLDKKADINKRGERGFTPLQEAARNSRDDRHDIACHDDIVSLLIKNGADVNAKTTDGETALTMAAQVCPGVAQVLIDNKADIHARNKYGRTALLNAVMSSGYYKFVYNPVKGRKEEDVINQDSYDLIKYLLEHGADPNVKDAYGKTMLGEAKSLRREVAVHLLEQYHARE